MGTHHSHPEVIKRLKRAHGHLGKVIEMVESERPCLEVAQQLQAVISALNNAKTIHVQDHIEHCLQEALAHSGTKQRAEIESFREIAKYL